MKFGLRLPSFAQLAEPGAIPEDVTARLTGVDPDAPDPANLFRLNQNIRPAATSKEAAD